MLKNILFSLLLVGYVISNSCIYAQNNTEDQYIEIEIETENGTIKKELMEFIEEGKLKMSAIYASTEVKNKAVMFLGLSGTGKTTLVNYLSGIPLVCKLRRGTWIIDLASENKTLPGGFKIGHKIKSETIYPAAYSPPDKDLTYIDNPGFQDTRGLGYNIANGFFRQEAIKDVEYLKLLLLITYQDLNIRGQQFRESIKRFSDFLGIFDEQDIKNLRKSIGIIVTRVENKGMDDLEMIEIVKEKLLYVVEDGKKQMTENEENVFRDIILNNQLQIFSNPEKQIILDDIQSGNISNLIDSLEYIRKEDAKIRVRIEESKIPELLVYIEAKHSKFIKELQSTLKINLFEIIKNKTDEGIFINENFMFVKSTLQKVLLAGENITDIEMFFNNLDQVFNEEERNHFISYEKTLKFFIDLLPEENKKLFMYKRQWLDNSVISEVNLQVKSLDNNLTNEIKHKYEVFMKGLDLRFNQIISFYVDFSKSVAVDKNDIRIMEENLADLRTMALKESTFDYFILYLNAFHYCEKCGSLFRDTIDEFTIAKNEIKSLINLTSDETTEAYFENNRWISFESVSKLNNMIDDAKICQNETYSYSNGNFTFSGYFTKLSSIIPLINENNEINNLKSVNIFSHYLLTFDEDFSIDKSKYQKDSPDFIIFGKKISIPNEILVDLSCLTLIHDFPDNQKKANNGVEFGQDGRNGKPGYPGYNGGNLVIQADIIENANNLIFLSRGGKGGPGQNGGDGKEGRKGQDAPYPDREDTYKNKGEKGGRGGNAGRGGCGGRGGNGGKSIMADVTQLIIKDENYVGMNGESGKRGNPGEGGWYGDSAYSDYEMCTGFWKCFLKIISFGLAKTSKWSKGMEPTFIRSERGYTPLYLNCENAELPIDRKSFVELGYSPKISENDETEIPIYITQESSIETK